MGRFAWDFGHSDTPDKRQSGGDSLGIFVVGRQVGFQELVFNPSSLMDEPNVVFAFRNDWLWGLKQRHSNAFFRSLDLWQELPTTSGRICPKVLAIVDNEC